MTLAALLWTLLLLTAPAVTGTRLVRRGWPRLGLASQLAIGITAGLGATLLCLRLVGDWDFRLAYPLLIGASLAELLFGWQRIPTSQPPLSSAPPSAGCPRITHLFGIGVVLVGAFTLRAYITHDWLLPPGFDPAFHLMLASRVAETHATVSTWQPYAPIGLNYPLTPHLLLAALSQVSGMPLDHAFTALLVLGGTLLVALVYALTHTATRCRLSAPPAALAALAAAGAFGWAAWLGSTGYLAWGGLPNLLGLCPLLAAICLISAGPVRGVARTLALALLLAAVVVTHHHIMLTGLAVFSAIALLGRRRDLLPAGGIALLAAAPHWLDLLRRLPRLGQTDVLRHVEALPTPAWLWTQLGPGFVILAAVALVASLRRPRSRRIRHALARPDVVATVVLLALWLVLDLGCRAIASLTGQAPFTLFTPSRFLTDAVPLLAALMGPGLATALTAALARLRVPDRAQVPVLLAVLILTALPLTGRVTDLSRYRPIDSRIAAACDFIRRSTPPDALIITDTGGFRGLTRNWFPYLTRRATTDPPLPTSEPLATLPPRPARLAAAPTLLLIRRATPPEPLPPLPAGARLLFATTPPGRTAGPNDILVFEIPPPPVSDNSP